MEHDWREWDYERGKAAECRKCLVTRFKDDNGDIEYSSQTGPPFDWCITVHTQHLTCALEPDCVESGTMPQLHTKHLGADRQERSPSAPKPKP